MGTNKAIQIYKMFLIKNNGWSKEDAERLNNGEIEGDPIYEGIVDILNGDKEK